MKFAFLVECLGIESQLGETSCQKEVERMREKARCGKVPRTAWRDETESPVSRGGDGDIVTAYFAPWTARNRHRHGFTELLVSEGPAGARCDFQLHSPCLGSVS